jgi:spore coat polysaccharide biosynthesis protein SpsF
MTSSRLPGKVLMKVLGKPILYYLVERLKQVSLLDDIVLWVA